MDGITINGQKADIVVESETNLGQVMAALDQWLDGSGQYLSGLAVDGTNYGSLSLDRAFTLELSGITTVDIITKSWAQLMFDLLSELRYNLELFGGAPREEQRAFRENWESSAASSFLKKNDKALQKSIIDALEETETPGAKILDLIDERLREIQNPHEEASALYPLIGESAKRLEDLNLDVQTGKDSRAAETIVIFSTLSEKIYRLLYIFKQYGRDFDSVTLPVDGGGTVTLNAYVDEFSAVLYELIDVYTNKDIILAGDLAEYELAPRMLALGSVLVSFAAGKGRKS
jgi:hypothetical protein